jgi:uncharacterized protein
VSLDELANFLNSSSAPPGCMDLSELDGFLAGLVAGPEVVPREEWLPEVWLDATQLQYSAILWQDEAGTTVAEDWAAGFMQAVSLRSEAWQPALADEDASVLLIPIASLAGMTLQEDERGGESLPDDALDALIQDSEQVLPVCVLGLRRFWRQNLPGGGMVRH